MEAGEHLGWMEDQQHQAFDASFSFDSVAGHHGRGGSSPELRPNEAGAGTGWQDLRAMQPRLSASRRSGEPPLDDEQHPLLSSEAGSRHSAAGSQGQLRLSQQHDGQLRRLPAGSGSAGGLGSTQRFSGELRELARQASSGSSRGARQLEPAAGSGRRSLAVEQWQQQAQQEMELAEEELAEEEDVSTSQHYMQSIQQQQRQQPVRHPRRRPSTAGAMQQLLPGLPAYEDQRQATSDEDPMHVEACLMGQQISAGSARRRWSPSGADRLARPGAAARLLEGEEAHEAEQAYSWQQEGRCGSAALPGSRRGSPCARLPGHPGSSAAVQAGARPPGQLQHKLVADGGELEPLHEQQRPRSGQRRGSPGDRSKRSPARPAFEGDLSEWGKPDLEELYDESASEAGSGTTLSSGLGPGGGRAPRRPNARPFDLEAAEAALSYGAGQYGRVQALRREGAAPAALGLADDLPTRMAYEQLNILAGMAGKVQDAILHNRRIFEQRLVAEQRSLLKRAWHAWRDTVRELAKCAHASRGRAEGPRPS